MYVFYDTGAKRHTSLGSVIMEASELCTIARKPAYSPVALLLLAIGILLTLTLLWVGRIIFLLLFAAIVFAVAMTAVVDWVCERLHVGRRIAFGLILLSAATAAVTAVWVIGSKVVAQLADLQAELPQAADHLLQRVHSYGWGQWMLDQWSDYSQLSTSVRDAVSRFTGIVMSTATVVGGLVLVVILGLYLAAEPETYLSRVRRMIPDQYKRIVEKCGVNAIRTVRWWLLSQLLSMSAVGLIVTLGLWFLGVPLAGTLGFIAALLTFIPNVGPVLSVVPAALLAFAISPMKGLLAIVLFMLVHFLEGNVITPLLERRIVSLPPAATMVAQLLLAVIAGPLGVALAAPLTAAAFGSFEVLFPPEKEEALAASAARALVPAV